ncbi:MAG: hypothetical protein IMY76_09125 [Chloroflexi bacterium]|nr:hypothetical protein [Chloroflexota bacterium]
MLISVFWPLNWALEGLRTHWAFFPLWLGYALVVDGLVLKRTGTSLVARSWKKYIGIFLISAPAWWLFEVINWWIGNWHYVGRAYFTNIEYAIFATLSFSTVMPAVFGTAELAQSLPFIRNLKLGPIFSPDRVTIRRWFIFGCIMFASLVIWPRYFFPLMWISIYFILEPINIWMGNHNLVTRTKEGDWRGVISLFAGVLLTAFFWEFWNYWAYPKWIYTVPFVDFWHIFEMPLLGYGGYLPFALELFALYHLSIGILGQQDKSDYILPQPKY